MATIELGANYDIEEDSNGDLVVKDSGGNTVLKHDESSDEWKSISKLSTDKVDTGQFLYDQGYQSEEDDNSPWNKSGSQSYTLTLAGTYDWVEFYFLDLHNDHTAGQDIWLRINELSSGAYDWWDLAGTKTNNASEFTLMDTLGEDHDTNGVVDVTGRWTIRAGVVNRLTGRAENNTSMHKGEVPSVTSPLDSIDVLGENGNISFTARAVGYTI